MGALLTALGSTLPDQVNLIVREARPKHFGIFLQGDDQASLPFGDGALCLSGAVVQFPPRLVQVGPDGSAAFGPCFGDAPISTSTGVAPGSGVTKRYQFWYRDPGGPCGSGFNASNGCEIAW